MSLLYPIFVALCGLVIASCKEDKYGVVQMVSCSVIVILSVIVGFEF